MIMCSFSCCKEEMSEDKLSVLCENTVKNRGVCPCFLVVFSVLTGCQSCSFAEFFRIAAWAGKTHRMSDLCDTPCLLAKHPHGNTQPVLEQVFTDGHSQGPVKIPATFSAAEIQGSRHFGQGKFFLVMIMQIPEHVSCPRVFPLLSGFQMEF